MTPVDIIFNKKIKHYNPKYDEVMEEVVTEDERFKYWREAVPEPMETKRFPFARTYYCICMHLPFNNLAEYELHYRKAWQEEKTIHDNGGKPPERFKRKRK